MKKRPLISDEISAEPKSRLRTFWSHKPTNLHNLSPEEKEMLVLLYNEGLNQLKKEGNILATQIEVFLNQDKYIEVRYKPSVQLPGISAHTFLNCILPKETAAWIRDLLQDEESMKIDTQEEKQLSSICASL